MYRSWADLDHAVEGLSDDEATTRYDGGSSIAWSVGHVTTQVDSWLNMRFQGLAPHPVFNRAHFRTGGSGDAANWASILEGVQEVRARARRYLDAEPAPDLDRPIAYDGAIEYIRPTGLTLRLALMYIAAHHFRHVGEIETIRSRLGHVLVDVDDWGRALM
jgi:uncharacterized damage-inducible protein DinB